MSTDTRTDEQILEALDFNHETPCEIGNHSKFGDGPAVFVIRQSSFCHGEGLVAMLCAGCWVAAGKNGVLCGHCGDPYTREQAWRIVRVIGGQS
ncbi:hypothetical protein [Segeticoccus rhizosphaerae]|uniref:hypothetical protein n=1 Tax=Segeticoccus rhizosphaerae TaxID=1104777 RepID=UPI001264A5EF|nr:hypothetical protein [Segeticoccus rhizosphaerae]